MSPNDQPNYYRLYRDVWDSIKGLPNPQGAKLLYAFAHLFFEGTDSPESLPKGTKQIYAIKRPDILNYRQRVLNGMRNAQNADRKLRKSTE